MTTCSSLGAGDGVAGVEMAAACRRVLTLDIFFYCSSSYIDGVGVACSVFLFEIRILAGCGSVTFGGEEFL